LADPTETWCDGNMHSTLSPCLVAVLTVASAASAFEPVALDAPTVPRSASLLDAHDRSHRSPSFSSSGSSDLLLNGLLLVGVGLVAGAGGFGIMAACPQGSACYSETLNTVAWVLAAPGIIPLVVGLFFIYLGSPNQHGNLLSPDPKRRWAFTFGVAPGGGSLGAVGRF
jgi:hypothetical protein